MYCLRLIIQDASADGVFSNGFNQVLDKMKLDCFNKTNVIFYPMKLYD